MGPSGKGKSKGKGGKGPGQSLSFGGKGQGAAGRGRAFDAHGPPIGFSRRIPRHTDRKGIRERLPIRFVLFDGIMVFFWIFLSLPRVVLLLTIQFSYSILGHCE